MSSENGNYVGIIKGEDLGSVSVVRNNGEAKIEITYRGKPTTLYLNGKNQIYKGQTPSGEVTDHRSLVRLAITLREPLCLISSDSHPSDVRKLALDLERRITDPEKNILGKKPQSKSSTTI